MAVATREVSRGDPFHHYVRENEDRMLLVFRGTSADYNLGCKIHCRSWKRQLMEAVCPSGDLERKGNEAHQRGRRTGIRQS